jgi:hypothetical protein
MALAVLRKWNAPSVVTNVTIDAAAGKATKAVNTDVTGIQKSETGVAWTQVDKALPLDINLDEIGAEMANRFAAIVNELDQQPLRVSGLAAGNYEVRIDGKPLGKFDASQLAAGVNLALLDTPMKEAAGELSWRVISEHNDTHAMRLRVLVHGNGSAESEQAAAYLQKIENDDKNSAQKYLELKPHKFEVTRI